MRLAVLSALYRYHPSCKIPWLRGSNPTRGIYLLQVCNSQNLVNSVAIFEGNEWNTVRLGSCIWATDQWLFKKQQWQCVVCSCMIQNATKIQVEECAMCIEPITTISTFTITITLVTLHYGIDFVYIYNFQCFFISN